MNTIVLNPKDKVISKTSSKGSQAKWNVGNKWYKQDSVGFESAGEVISSRIAHLLNVCTPIVDYSPCYLKLPTGVFLGCESDSFLSPGDLETSGQRILEKNMGITLANKLLHTQQVHYLITLYPCLADHLSCVFQFDRLVRNLDRHMHNIVVRNLKEIVLFDNGDSCTADITYDYPEGITHQEILAVDTAKPLMKSFDASCEFIREFSSFQLEAIDNKLLISDLYTIYPEWFIKRVMWLLAYQFQKYLGVDLQFY